ncbi:hypothetical protein D3C71_1731730 [compost metagenome]
MLSLDCNDDNTSLIAFLLKSSLTHFFIKGLSIEFISLSEKAIGGVNAQAILLRAIYEDSTNASLHSYISS